MKINPILILKDHFLTLRNAASEETSFNDILIFYVLPAALGFCAYWLINLANLDFYNLSITFFGIFIALLLNVQVAAFGIFQRKWEKNVDPKIEEIIKDRLNVRRILLGEINANISYAVLISIFALFIFIILFGSDFLQKIATPIIVFIYSHFLLILLMIVKRSHALFRTEYEDNS